MHIKLCSDGFGECVKQTEGNPERLRFSKLYSVLRLTSNIFVVFILLLSKYAVERESVGVGVVAFIVHRKHRVCSCYFCSTQ